MPTQNGPVDPDTLITIKVAFDGENRRFKVPLRDLGAHTFPQRIRQLLNVPQDADLLLQRYSDSAGKYLTLDSEHPPIYKQLYRAAKAKLKLRIQVDRVQPPVDHPPEPEQAAETHEPVVEEELDFGLPDTLVSKSDQPVVEEELDFGLPDTLVSKSDQAVDVDETFDEPQEHQSASQEAMEKSQQPDGARASYLETVLSQLEPAVPVADPSFHEAQAEPSTEPSAEPSQAEQQKEKVARRAQRQPPTLPANTSTATYTCAILIDCNHCNASIPNEHYHCSICEDGDYDLCLDCIDKDVLCPNGSHWLIKRSIVDGVLVKSTTEIVGPNYIPPPAKEPVPPPTNFTTIPLVECRSPNGGTIWYTTKVESTSERKEVAEDESIPERTCNVCIRTLPVTVMCQCNDCQDFDVCFDCMSNDRGHHNASHSFTLIQDTGDRRSERIRKFLCQPGGPVVHGAICDDCDQLITGLRYKCLECPNWDVCYKCFPSVDQTHPGHRFAPLSEPIPYPHATHPEIHSGVYCDGVLCRSKMGREYISGVRYKCVVCHDTDLCATCEAHPHHSHNRTHPLLKFKAPVKHVSVAAYGEDEQGMTLEKMGDKYAPEEPKAESPKCDVGVLPLPPALPLFEPVVAPAFRHVHPPMALNDQDYMNPDLFRHLTEKPEDENENVPPVAPATPEVLEENSSIVTASGLNPLGLHTRFLSDTIPDGQMFAPNTLFTKTWTLQNPGPSCWPAGTSARFIGGDAMFNVDTTNAISLNCLVNAMESQRLTEPVYPGNIAEFTVRMKAPSRPGKAISYWRLKADDAGPFGHKLWCDINVLEEPSKSSEQKSHVMVFPTLEKESPIGSVHGSSPVASPVDPRETIVTRDHGAESPVEIIDLTEEVESLTLDNESTQDSNESFLTDDEYDILDASDEEYAEIALASEQKKKEKK